MAHPNPDDSGDGTVAGEPGVWRSPTERVVEGLETVAYWTGVLLPLVFGAVVLTDLNSPAQWRLFVVLGATSVAALYLGHVRDED